jgi:hypothetical protein
MEYRDLSDPSIEEEFTRKFAAICDTREEFLMLHNHSVKCMEEHKKLTKKQTQEFKAFFAEQEK